MDSARVRIPLAVLGLSICFYFLTSISFEPMPFTSFPSWWMGIWPSRGAGLYVWFGLLNAAGALIAAVPVATLLRWLVEADQMRAAFIVGVMTASAVAGSTVIKYSPMNRAAAFMAFDLFTVVLLAVPVLTWILRALPLHKQISNSGRS
jgi:hypothetical protein